MADQRTTAPVAAYGVAVSAGLLLLRMMLGLIMATHGAQKLFGWFGGGGINGTAKGFAHLGYPWPRTMALVCGLCEGLGGVGIFLGLLTPLAAAALLGNMINALWVTWDKGFEAVEFGLLIAAAAAALALTGPGWYSVDHYLPGLRAHRLVYGVGAIVLAAVAATVVLLLRA
ncbi:DoxX family membrane protein [Streptomyces orinoci]|uniref:DoxX family membrane protein n=1 Tax=Streptomyces orinoci TaxID=67339 RepID=A0ABV3JXV9_STRON|nr:DoxX family membrane protein [Streptomyces orinoci]